jgi:hypothetical protein
MTLWFDPATWRKRAGTPAAKSGCTPRDTATVATGMAQARPAEKRSCAGTPTAGSVENLSVATVAMSQGRTSAEADMLLRDDVLERAAILEFCEGLTRTDADAQALAEFTADWRHDA